MSFKIPKLLKPFLKPTELEKIPTDKDLDIEIEYFTWLFKAAYPILKKIVKEKIKRFFLYRWKLILYRFLQFIIISITICVIVIYVIEPTVEYIYPPSKIINERITQLNDSSMTLNNLLEQIKYVESRNNYEANREGSQYWGAYQIGYEERKVAGYGDIPKYAFLNHPEIQDACMINLMKHNYKVLKKYIDRYSGKIVGGILVTESGIVAMAHTGAGNVINFLESNGRIIGKDAMGTKCTIYLKLAGYDISKIKN